jgi:aldose 1-epimerase
MESGHPHSILSFHADRIVQNGWEEVVLRDSHTGMVATIIPSAGGILNKLEVPHNGKTLNLVDGFQDAADWQVNKTNGFKSAKLSPFVCRLFNASYAWQGTQYTTEKFKVNGHALHGLLYDVEHSIEFVEAAAFMAECKLRYRYKGTDPGFPFAFDMNIRYRIEGGCRLTITTTVHNRSGRNIPICDGWHPYFKLGEQIDTATLQINATKQVELNELLIPTGKIVRNKKWFKGASLKDQSLDSCFLLKQDEPLPHCTLSDESVGLALYIYPDAAYPYLVVYTPDHRQSIAIENMSAPPDAFNNKMGLIELGPEDSKYFTTKYRIAKIEPQKKPTSFASKLRSYLFQRGDTHHTT